MSHNDSSWPWPTPAPGVYFGMGNDEYHAIPALNSSILKLMFKKASTFYHNSWLNPHKKAKAKTPAMIAGTAYHTRILEGKAAFDAQYCAAFKIPDGMTDIISTTDDMVSLLKLLGVKGYSTLRKTELLKLCKQHAPRVQYLDDLKEKYAQQNAGKIQLSDEDMAVIEYAAQQIEGSPQMRQHFVGGYPEVTIIWDDAALGVRLKARIDYLKISNIVDLKTYTHNSSRHVDVEIDMACARHRYLFSAYLYLYAVQQARRMVAAGQVFSNNTQLDPAWLQAFAAGQTEDFRFIFNEKDDGMTPRGWVFSTKDPDIEDRLAPMLAWAVNEFKHYYNRYGASPWIDNTQIVFKTIGELMCDHFSIPHE